MLVNQRHKFQLADEVIYLNNAYMSPSLNAVADAGIEAVNKKRQPNQIIAKDFFEPVTKLKHLFSKLISNNEPERIAILPSASYGIATVCNNIKVQSSDEVVVLGEQFPSNMYSWIRLCNEEGATLKVISKPEINNNVGQIWNEHVLDAINENTAVIAMPHVHWADGTKFDLKAIREKSKKHNALLIIDGTQSVGALPFSVAELQPDALVCSGYKWLMGPYASALAYFGPYFDQGTPIEENWSNRLNSEYFAGLTEYEDEYKPLANRYNVGEQAHFIAVPMLNKALEQLLEWTPDVIQNYCETVVGNELQPLLDLGCEIESADYRGQHLFGIKLPENINLEELKQEFTKSNIFISIRGSYIRVSIHVYNTADDIRALVKVVTRVAQLSTTL